MTRLIFVVYMLLISACSSVPTIKEMTVRMGDTESITIVDMRSVVRNNLLTAQVTLTNSSDSKLVAYRFKWLGNNSLRVSDDEVWKPLTLGKGQTIDVIGIAPSPEVTDFKIEFNSYK